MRNDSQAMLRAEAAASPLLLAAEHGAAAAGRGAGRAARWRRAAGRGRSAAAIGGGTETEAWGMSRRQNSGRARS